MAIRHREVFPEGSSPDSIDWRWWNDEHVGIAGSITQDQQDALDAANAPDGANPFATMADVGSADFSAVAEDILPATDDTYDIGSPSKRWAEGHYADFLKVGIDGVEAELQWTMNSFGGELLLRTRNGLDVLLDQIEIKPRVLKLFNSEGVGIFEYDFMGGTNSKLIMGDGNIGERAAFEFIGSTFKSVDGLQQTEYLIDRIDIQDDSGAEKFRVAVQDGVDTDLRAAALPATDPAVASQIFTMDAAGVGAALAAGARYLLISDGP